MEQPTKRLVLGVLAHVDSGKTTLSEAVLYQAGELRRLGRVDHGDAALDTDSIEQARGITIFSGQASFHYGGTQFTLLDTPGHVDFSAEMERSMQVLDYAVLVISGASGIQSHTETLWRMLGRYKIPTFLFVNKMDLAGAERTRMMEQICRHFGDGCMDFAMPNLLESEHLALCDETMMDEYLATGHVEEADVCRAIAQRSVFPCWFGSALRQEGIQPFLEGLARWTVQSPATDGFGARVFKISEDEQGRRLTHLKVTGGCLYAKMPLEGTDKDGIPWQEKADALRVYTGAKSKAIDEAWPGMLCAVTGLSHTHPGQGLGVQPSAAPPLLEPVLAYRVILSDGTNAHTALVSLRKMEEEDPQLHIVWDAALQEIRVQLMGEVQLEVLQAVALRRFGLQLSFGEGSILYKETISCAVEGVGHYEPLRHYAEVHLRMEPAPRGSGLQFASDCREEQLDRNWQRLILTHLEEKQYGGVLMNAPITDMRITLIAGKAHLKHTEGGDFRQATYRAMRQGLETARAQGGALLLEPWYNFRLELPAEDVGRAMADIQRMAGNFTPPQTFEDCSVLEGSVPAATLRGYPAELAAYTKGKGSLSCTLKGYEPCHDAQAVLQAAGYESERDTMNPADSVFCSHGAGYTVKWNEAPAHMHIESSFGKELARQSGGENAEAESPNIRSRAQQYRGTLEQDKELLAIFERTYGPIRRNAPAAVAPLGYTAGQTDARPRPQQEKALAAKPQPGGPDYLLVDGYNIIFAWDELAKLAQEDLAAARRKLADLLCNYCGYRRCKLILVYDAYRVKGGVGGVEPYHNITIVYTKEAETADTYIERATHELSRTHRVRVATSDGAEQMIVMGNGALRISARQFRAEMDEVEKEIRAYLTQE